MLLRENTSGLARRLQANSDGQKERSPMNRFPLYFLNGLLCLAFASTTLDASSEQSIRAAIVGDAILNNKGYQLLETMTTRYGPRLTGTEGNIRSMDLLEEELHQLGIETRRERYTIPGWIRGNDSVALVSPPARPLRAVALGYCEPHEPIEASVALVDSIDFDQMEADALRGKIALFVPNLRFSPADYDRLADEFGVVGALQINRVNGGQLLARTASHIGVPPPFPIYSVTVEEGRWIQRQLEDGMPVSVRMETQSKRTPMTIDNLVAVLPGRSDQIIVIGGHFDSWDLGQGAIDNGLGVAQLFDTARLLKIHQASNEHTVEIVWFNAEEWGLWGSKDYAERHDLAPVRCMLNLDMVGEPIAINAMGFDQQVPFLEDYVKNLGAWNLKAKVDNKPWLGSDHHPFILNGVPAITFNAPVAPDDVRYYHDFADTFEKVDPEMLARATALTALLAYDLANEMDTAIRHLNEQETAGLFRKAGLEQRMRKAGQWPFGDKPEDKGSEEPVLEPPF